MTTAPTRVDARETVASTEDLARVTVRYLAGALPSWPDESSQPPSLVANTMSRMYCFTAAGSAVRNTLAPRASAFCLNCSASSSKRAEAPPLIPAIWSRTARVSGSCLRDDIDAYVRACPRIASVLDGWVPGMIVDPILVDRPVLWGVLVGALPRISRA